MKKTDEEKWLSELKASSEENTYLADEKNMHGLFSRLVERAKQIGAKYYLADPSGNDFQDKFQGNSPGNFAS
jgi:hypothetical protein